MILSFIATKGGTGKSTLSETIAFSKTFEKKFDSTALIELDPQGTIESWYSERDEKKKGKDKVKYFNLARATRKEISDQLNKIVNDFDNIILDVPGESVEGFSTILALNLSDVVVIPMRASDKDENAFFDNLYPVIETTLRKDNGADFFVLPNFINPSTKAESVKGYYEDLLPGGISYMGNYVSNRVIFEGYSSSGKTLREYCDSVKGNKRQHIQAKKAVDEIEAIAKLILNVEAS